ncbi:ATP-binding protein (plasmid) [Streptomyces sp. LZ34]
MTKHDPGEVVDAELVDGHLPALREDRTLAVPPPDDDPDAWLSDQAKEDVNAGIADGTRDGYKGDMDRFAEWCVTVDRRALPAAPQTVTEYLSYLKRTPRPRTGRPYGPRSMDRIIASIRSAHRAAGYKPPDTMGARTMLAALVLGLAFIAAGVRLAPVMLKLHARWSRRLLSAPLSTELARRVERLTDIRDESLDAQAAELRRIERDLHDGAQARLVALGMTLDEATRLLGTGHTGDTGHIGDIDLSAVRALLLDVRESSARALQDLRDLVHGIQPPVLADRGLGDAVRSLALDSFLDVHVEVHLPPGRLPAPVESAAYFAVSELLANAAKHSGAQEVRISLTHEIARLHITVTDDGRGGADLSHGTGLRGVQRRLGTFDGTLALRSPPGGPTTVTLEIPCASSSPKTSSCSGTG